MGCFTSKTSSNQSSLGPETITRYHQAGAPSPASSSGRITTPIPPKEANRDHSPSPCSPGREIESPTSSSSSSDFWSPAPSSSSTSFSSPLPANRLGLGVTGTPTSPTSPSLVFGTPPSILGSSPPFRSREASPLPLFGTPTLQQPPPISRSFGFAAPPPFSPLASLGLFGKPLDEIEEDYFLNNPGRTGGFVFGEEEEDFVGFGVFRGDEVGQVENGGRVGWVM